MSPGDYRKDSFKSEEVIIRVFIFVCYDLFYYIVRVDVERYNEHRNMHGGVTL